MDIVTYALLKKGLSSSSIYKDSIIINDKGEIEVITKLGSINVNMNTGYLETDIEGIFSIQNGYLVSSI